VESLIYLAVGVDQIGIVDRKNVVHVKINFKTRLLLREFKDGDSSSWDHNQSALLGDSFDDLCAEFEQLMLVKCELILNNAGHIDVRLLNIPQSVLARTESTDFNLSDQQLWIVSVGAILEGLLNIKDNSISKLQIFPRYALFLVNHSYQALNL